MATLSAVALNCTLKASPAKSSCELLLSQVLSNLADHDVEGEILRVVDFDVHPGVSSDEGDGDQWPELRRRILDADMLVLGTPIWMGHPASVCNASWSAATRSWQKQTSSAGWSPMTASRESPS